MPSTRQKWTANSMIGPVVHPPTLNRSPMRPSQLARAVVSPRVSRPALSTLSRQSSRRSERRLAKRTISAYPVCPLVHYTCFILVLIQNKTPHTPLSPRGLSAPSETNSLYLAHRARLTNSNFSQHHTARWGSWAVPRSRSDHPRLPSDVGHLLRRV